jgi:hypothetical protein
LELIWVLGLLKVGIEWDSIQITPIFIGKRDRSEIFWMIMNEEMFPWRLNNDYDRPIACALRHMFGQHKIAILTSFALLPASIDAELRCEYLDSYESTAWSLLLDVRPSLSLLD